MTPPTDSLDENRRDQRRKILMERGTGRTIGTYPQAPFEIATYNVSSGGLMAHCQPNVGPMLFTGDRVQLDIPIGEAANPERELGSVLGRIMWSAPGGFDNPRLPRLDHPLGNHWCFGIAFDRVQEHVIQALLSRA